MDPQLPCVFASLERVRHSSPQYFRCVSAVWQAAKYGHKECLEALLELNDKLYAMVDLSWVRLTKRAYYIIHEERKDRFRGDAYRFRTIDSVARGSGLTAIEHAAEGGHVECVRLLVERRVCHESVCHEPLLRARAGISTHNMVLILKACDGGIRQVSCSLRCVRVDPHRRTGLHKMGTPYACWSYTSLLRVATKVDKKFSAGHAVIQIVHTNNAIERRRDNAPFYDF